MYDIRTNIYNKHTNVIDTKLDNIGTFIAGNCGSK